MATLRQLTERIQAKVPLLPDETEHDWRHVTLTGCGTCGRHDGFECVNCRRCVDATMDAALYAAVFSLVSLADFVALLEKHDEQNNS